MKLKLAVLLIGLVMAIGWWISHSTKPVTPYSESVPAQSGPTPPSQVILPAPLVATQSLPLATPSIPMGKSTSPHAQPHIASDPALDMPLLQISETPDPAHPEIVTRVRIVRAHFKYPLWRIEETIVKPQAGQPETVQSRSIMIADHVMIRLNEKADPSQLDELVQTQGLSIRKAMKMPGCYLISIPDESTNALPRLLAILNQKKDLIRYVEPDYVVHSQQTIPNDPKFSLLWGLNNNLTPAADISAPQIWDFTTGSTQLVIGCIDTGIDYNHPDLASNIWRNTTETLNGIDDDGNGYIDDVRGWNFVTDKNTPTDDHGHGTHTAGTIGAIGNNGIGVVGVNWRCQLIPLKFLDSSGSGVISDATDALHYVADLRRRGVNIRITNNSWGGGNYSSAFRDALAENASLGILFMAAAGNDSLNNDVTPLYPACYNESNVIAIAATDAQDALADFSHYGTNTVHLAAPGVNICSTYYRSQYAYMSGTSMATPHVAGVAALLWSLWPTARAQDIRESILKGVDIIPALATKTITGGRLNARKAVDALFRILHTPHENTFNRGIGYAVDSDIGPSVLTDTNQVFVFWAPNNSTNFTAATCRIVSNTIFEALLPEQLEGSTIQYWVQAAATNGLVVKLPADAPSNTFSFSVVPPISLFITGTPANVTTAPDYGEHFLASGKVVQASAPELTAPVNGKRWSCSGWLGSGNIPSSGTTNVLSFTLTTPSILTWQWQAQYALIYTSLCSSLNTTSWWNEGTLATTLQAPETTLVKSIPYRFAGWDLDGARQPDATHPAINPVGNILMSSPHQVIARYLPESQDSDGNGLNDWWEMRYLGSLSTDPNADPDQDGFSNQNEFKDQTNPIDRYDFPRPPVILHTPLNPQQPVPAPYTLSAIITDNCQVVSAIMYWSRNGGSIKATSMTAGTNHVFTASLPSPGTNGDFFTYSIVAADLLATSTNGPYSVYPSYPEICSTPSSFSCLLLPETTSNLLLTVTNSGVGAWQGEVSILWGGTSNNVENGTVNWTHSGINDLWNISSNLSKSAAQSWYCGDPTTFQYTNNMHAKLDSAPFYVAAGAQLTFWHWIECELDWFSWLPGWKYSKTWDGGIVEISTNYGASFFQITPVGGYPNLISGYDYADAPWPDETPCFAGDGSSWNQATFNLSSFTGSVAILRFHFGSDPNTVETGWFVDDIVVSPIVAPSTWLTPISTNLTAPPKNITLIPLATLSSAGIPTGDRAAVIQINGNTITNSQSFIPIHLSVRSPATLTWASASQTSTNGTGLVTLTHHLYDADGDPCQAEIEWSSSPCGSWSNPAISSVHSEVGQAQLTGIDPLPISNLGTRCESGLITNTIFSVWNSQAPGNAIVYCSNTFVRARSWDGIFWSQWVTSQPFMVDNEAPPTPTHCYSLVHQTNAWSKNPIMSLRWDTVQESRGSGVANYEYGATTNPPVVGLFLSTTNRAGSTVNLNDGTNLWGWVRARDRMGNLSVPAFYGPCWIDGTPPSAAGAIITLRLSPYGNYVVNSNSVTGIWSGFSDGAGSGILGYYFAPTNGGGTAQGTWTLTPQGVLSNLKLDQTNSLYVWAKDQTGWIGQATKASFIALSSGGDWDHDGILNWQEEFTGTDALLGGSAFQLGVASSDSLHPNSFTLRWPGISNRNYTITYKDSLTAGTSWVNLPGATAIPGTTGMMSFTDNTITHDSRFYRISVVTP